jgi:carbonic anhydrase/acetyltransferase-like protein (isoleucine patch superfamily)
MAAVLYRFGQAVRESGQALERLGCTLQGSKAWAEEFYRHTPLLNLGTLKPNVSSDSFVAPSAAVTGDVSIGSQSSVWYNTVIRADEGKVQIGSNSNLQDGVTVTTVRSSPIEGADRDTVIGDNVTIGHGAMLHCCTINDEALVGMGAIICEGAVVESGAMVAAGAVVKPGTVVPAGQVWGGNPARQLRTLKPEEAQFMLKSAEQYASLAGDHRKEVDQPLEELWFERHANLAINSTTSTAAPVLKE